MPEHTTPPIAPAATHRRGSYKAMGVSNVFFGLLAEIGALANYSSGMGIDRTLLSALLGATLLVMGITLIQKNAAPRR